MKFLRPFILLSMALCLTGGFATSASAQSIKLGLVGIMTGPNAQNGEFCRNGATLAIDEINAAGGVKTPDGKAHQLSLEVVDDQGKPDIGLNAIRRLASSDDVMAFMGPDFTGITLPSLFVGEEAGMAQITSSIGAAVTAQGDKHIFRGRSNDKMWMTALVDYIANTLHAKSIGISVTNIELGRSGRDVAIKYLQDKYQMTPVVDVSHGFGDRDLTASAARIVQANPDVVINWGTQIEAALLVRKLRQLGWQGVFAFNAADDIFTNLAKEDSIGVIGPQNWVWSKSDEHTQKFVAAYEARYGKKPSPHSIVYYDGAKLYADAIAKAGADRHKILAALKAMPEWQGVQGTYHPDARNGDMISDTVIIRYDDKIQPEVVFATK
ncbi:ABC transporter substrate-binding protein [Alcaligenaceae bacterium CGII-47]|nr:ABC transporter substrate-binding protein [Alcaligenaceae bacterium CGII-47]